MTIFEYLQAKYGEQGPFVLTAMEATSFGIKYPLETGWVDKHGPQEIGIKTANKLADQLYLKGMRTTTLSKANYCLAGAAILRGIAKVKGAEFLQVRKAPGEAS